MNRHRDAKKKGLAMQLRVSERGDEVHVELIGVAGRQQRVLEALNECQRNACRCQEGQPIAGAEVSVRAGANDMRIRLKGRDGMRFEAASIYRCLRHALIETPDSLPASTANAPA